MAFNGHRDRAMCFSSSFSLYLQALTVCACQGPGGCAVPAGGSAPRGRWRPLAGNGRPRAALPRERRAAARLPWEREPRRAGPGRLGRALSDSTPAGGGSGCASCCPSDRTPPAAPAFAAGEKRPIRSTLAGFVHSLGPSVQEEQRTA